MKLPTTKILPNLQGDKTKRGEDLKVSNTVINIKLKITDFK